MTDYLGLLNALDENERLEAKRGTEIGPSVLETICAFANEPGLQGGVLLLGIARDESDLFSPYVVEGVAHPDNLSASLATQCREQFNVPVRVQIATEQISGKPVLVATVPEAQPGDKPVFIKSRGLPKGAFRRIGSTDQQCTEDDLLALYEGRQSESFDYTVLPDTSMADLSPEAIAEYRRVRADANPDAEELRWSDDELVEALGCARRQSGALTPTVAGLLLFGRTQALRRVYRSHAPIQNIRYSNRLEIHNPGHSLKSPEHLGEPGSVPRNPRIAAVLLDTRFAETKGSGIKVMREMMTQAGLEPPLFESIRSDDKFVARYYFQHFLSEEAIRWLSRFRELALSDEEARALVAVREQGAIDNAMYRELNRIDTLGASQALRRLRDAGLLEQRGRGSGTYYIPTPRLLGNDEGAALSSDPDGLSSNPGGLSTHPDALSTNLGGLPTNLAALSANPHWQALPHELQQMVAALGLRASPDKVREALIRLCRHRPWQASELAGLFNRNAHYLGMQYLRPLVSAGVLAYTRPDAPNHPHQAYTATDGEGSARESIESLSE